MGNYFKAEDIVTPMDSAINLRVVGDNPSNSNEVVTCFNGHYTTYPKSHLRHKGSAWEEELHERMVYGDAFDYSV